MMIPSSAFAVSEEECLAKLQQPNLPRAELVATLRALSTVATTASVAMVEPWLTDSELSHMALYSMHTIASPVVNDVLLRALERSTGVVRAGLIESLGHRRVSQAVPKLAALVSDSSTDLESFTSAALALGSMGGAGAVAALWNAYERTQGGARAAVTEGLLRCIQGAAKSGSLEAAREWARRLEASHPPPHVRAALVRWFLRYGEATDLERTRMAWLGGSPEDVDSVLSAVLDDPSPILPWLVVETEDTGLRRQMAAVLARLGASTTREHLKKLLQDSDPEVRAIALRGLSRWNDPAVFTAFEAAWADSNSVVRTAVRESLAGYPSTDADTWLIARACPEAAPPLRLWAIELFGQRATTTAVPALIVGVADSSSDVRRAAWAALKTCATAAHLDLLLNAAPRDNGDDLRGFESALMAVLGQVSTTEVDAAAQRITARWKDAPEAVRPVLLRAWRRVGGAVARQALIDLAEQDSAYRVAAGRLLCEWPSSDVFPWLWRAATEHPDPAVRRQALHAAMRWIPDLPEPESQKIHRLQQWVSRLESREDRLKWVAAAGRIASPKTLELLLDQVDLLSEVADEFAAAVADLVEAVGQSSPDLARRAAEVAAARCTEDALRRRLQRWLRGS
jgi:HEAT repeat protein